jgi:hypothetical protein
MHKNIWIWTLCTAFLFLIAAVITVPVTHATSIQDMKLERGYDTGYISLCNTNCGFEYGDLYSWSTYYGGVTLSTDAPRSGRWAVNGSWYSSDTVYKTFFLSSSLYSYIDDSNGRFYHSSYVHPSSSESVRVRTKYLSASGSTIDERTSNWQATTSGWQQLSGWSMIPAGTRQIRVYFDMKRSSGDFTDVDIDDVSVTIRFAKIDPPTSTPIPTSTPVPTSTPTTPAATATQITGTSSTKIVGRIADASTNKAIANAYVCISTPNRCTYTNSMGMYSLTARSPSSQQVSVSHPNYIYLQESITLTSAPTRNHYANLVKPFAADKIKIVVSWDAKPSNLDAYMFVEKPTAVDPANDYYHVYEGSGSCLVEPFACIQTTSSTGFGPELLTINKILPRWYQFAVLQVSNSGSVFMHGKPRVHVYKGSNLIQTFSIPTSTAGCGGANCMWYVFNFTGADGVFSPFFMGKSSSHPSLNAAVEFRIPQQITRP